MNDKGNVVNLNGSEKNEKKEEKFSFNLNQPVLNLVGKPLQTPQKEDLTYKDVAVESLMYTEQTSQVNAKEKVKRYCLAKRIYENFESEIELSKIEAQNVFNLSSKLFDVLVTGRIYELLSEKISDL